MQTILVTQISMQDAFHLAFSELVVQVVQVET